MLLSHWALDQTAYTSEIKPQESMEIVERAKELMRAWNIFKNALK
jgi:hypothetical protein